MMWNKNGIGGKIVLPASGTQDSPMRRELSDLSIDSTMSSLGSKATYMGAGTAFVFGWSASEFAAVAGVLIAVVGLAVNIYFSHRNDKRNSELHAAHLRALERRNEHAGQDRGDSLSERR